LEEEPKCLLYVTTWSEFQIWIGIKTMGMLRGRPSLHPESWAWLALIFVAAVCLAYSSLLKMEAVCSSKTSVNLYQRTQHHIPEDSIYSMLHALTFVWTMVGLQLNYKLWYQCKFTTMQSTSDVLRYTAPRTSLRVCHHWAMMMQIPTSSFESYWILRIFNIGCGPNLNT
jgi:hypothetical protein